MFPGATAATRKVQRKMFALDVKVRCHRIHSDMHRMHNGNLTKVASLMPRVIETTLDCYGGDCKKCKYPSVICSGGKGNWWKKSIYLQTGTLHYHNMTSADRITLSRILQLRLGGNAQPLTKLCLNTNRNEGLNRRLSASLPKNVNFSRNVKGCACAAIDRLNYGAGDSLLRKLERSKAPITKGGKVAKAVRQMHLVTTYNRIYRSKSSVRRRLRYNMWKRFSAARASKRRRQASSDTIKDAQKKKYRKGQLDETLKQKKMHSYNCCEKKMEEASNSLFQ